MVRLKNFMTSTFVTLCSFASLLVALFCSDIYAFLGARALIVTLQTCPGPSSYRKLVKP